jgi:hypothetical protein
MMTSIIAAHLLFNHQAAGTLLVPDFRLIGRFAKVGTGYACEWPGSTVEVMGTCPSLDVTFNAETDRDRWQVELQGQATRILKLKKGKHKYKIDMPGRGSYMVRLVRRTEAFQGTTEFFPTPVSNSVGTLPKPNKRTIEIIGDSISAGFGVDGKSKDEKYSDDTANAYLTYGMIAARRLNCDATVIAWSGKKMWPDNDIPSIYDLVLPSKPNSPKWDFTVGKKPDAVLINLATNDFGRGVPDEVGWKQGYLGFVKRVRSNYPKAMIYLATGSMMSDSWPVGKKHLSTLKGWLDDIAKTAKDKRIRRIDFAVQEEKDGIGSAWHPNSVTQAKMADVFEEALRADLKWQ